MDVIHPMIYAAITWIPHVVGIILLSILMCVFTVDCVLTVMTILKFNKRLKIMDELASSIHKLSDEIGESIYENVTGVIEKSEEFQENHVELMDKLAETKDNLTELPQTAKNKLAETKDNLTELPQTAKNKLVETKDNITESLEEKRKERELALELKKKERAELEERYEKLYEEKSFGFKRLIKAFPDMKSRDNNETLEKYKLHFNIRKKESNDNSK